MNPVTLLTSRLGIRYPIVQAPMAGVSTPALAAAVSNAGGLGSLGIGNLAVGQAADIIRQTRALTTQPFNVNVFCHQPARRNPQREADWLAYLSHTFAIPADQLPAALNEIYPTALGNAALLNMLLAERPAVVSFHFGVPGEDWISALREAGVVMLGCATSLPEAQQLQQAGVDVIVAQGMEAGGHRGIFDPGHDPLLGTFALTRLLASHLAVPVIAAGGIMDGSGIAAAIQLGAAGVQMGTAFIACPESSASAAYRQQLLGPDAQHTSITAAISGRPARGMVNKMYLPDTASLPLPDYPVAYDAVKALYQLAAAQGCHDYAAHWAGQGAPLARAMPAAELLQQLVEEWQAVCP